MVVTILAVSPSSGLTGVPFTRDCGTAIVATSRTGVRSTVRSIIDKVLGCGPVFEETAGRVCGSGAGTFKVGHF